MALSAQTPVATTVSTGTTCGGITSSEGDTRKESGQFEADAMWIFAGCVDRAGWPDGVNVLTQRRGGKIGLDVRSHIANNLVLAHGLVWKAIETRLARPPDFVASVELPSGDSFHIRQLLGFRVPSDLVCRLNGTLTAVRTAAVLKTQKDAGRSWLLVLLATQSGGCISATAALCATLRSWSEV